MSTGKSNNPLPDSFRKYFWDVAFSELSLEKNPGFIAERVLNYGTGKDVKWLLQRIDSGLIKSLVKDSRNLNAKTRNYWQIMLD